MITNENALRGLMTINALLQSPEKKPTKFVFGLIKNKQLLESVSTAYNETLQKTDDDDFLAFQSVCVDLDFAKDYALLDDQGKPVINPSNNLAMIDPAKAADYDRACIQMAMTKPEWSVALQKRANAVASLNSTDSDITPYVIRLQDFPDEISGAELESLYFLIED